MPRTAHLRWSPKPLCLLLAYGLAAASGCGDQPAADGGQVAEDETSPDFPTLPSTRRPARVEVEPFAGVPSEQILEPPDDLPDDPVVGEPARLLAPMSTSYVNTTIGPRVEWTHPDGLQRARVEFCVDRGCEALIAEVDGYDGIAQSYDYFPSGPVFWRVFAIDEQGAETPPSETWQFHARPGEPREMTMRWGSVADYNGDGLADIAIGEVHFLGESGRVYVMNGRASGLTSTVFGTEPAGVLSGTEGVDELGIAKSEFASAIASAGDLNGDGFADLVVGARCAASCGLGESRAYVFYGGPDGLSEAPNQTLFPPIDSGFTDFGAAVAAAGDVDHDGYGDLIVGAPDRNPDEEAGRVYVYRGSAWGVADDPTLVLVAPNGEASFGSSVAAGVTTYGGEIDLVVGAPLEDQGTVYLYGGAAGALWDQPSNVLVPNEGREFGTSLALLYVNGPLRLAVGAPEDRAPGRVHVYDNMYNGGLAIPGIELAPRLTLVGSGVHDDFGRQVSSGNDLNSDGVDDLLVGVPGVNIERGEVLIYFGNRWTTEIFDTEPVRLAGSDERGRFGHAVSGVGDINGDGSADLLVASPAIDAFEIDGNAGQGGATLFYGPQITRRVSESFFGPSGFGLTLGR